MKRESHTGRRASKSYIESCIDRDGAERLARTFKALGHPMRLQLVAGLMKQECNVKHMTECLGVAQATVSQQLAVLRAAEVVTYERKGNQVCYRVTSPWLRQLVSTVAKAQKE
ncbi:winged helix-turn-helix transcriptional regulator [candidate division WOR-3 bacterium]|uniref:Winged helix-turn-helix transcriptional regulator n=1 Tax=candidate division WOR-3 bacterium TaxID=2052148 RepID=A0A938BP13_UNCW3|nr:winged helix-turn-helix transcriptional regulator [candidate division WOR-3 bacterium]